MSTDSAPLSGPPQPQFPPLLILAGGLVAISFSAIFIRLAQDEAPSLVIAAGRLMIAGLILLPPALLRRRHELAALALADWRLAFISGFFLAVHFAAWITSLEFTSIATSTVLVTTSPLWVGLASPFVLGERVTRPLKIGIALALLGTLLISFDGANAIAGRRPFLGNGLAILGAAGASVYFLIGRRLRPRLSLLSYTAVVYGTAALFLLLFTLAAGHSLFGYSPTTYGLILLMALFPQLLGHTAYNWALAFLPAAFVIVTLVSEPVGATLLAILFFGAAEVPGVLTLLGAIVVLLGIIIAARTQR